MVVARKSIQKAQLDTVIIQRAGDESTNFNIYLHGSCWDDSGKRINAEEPSEQLLWDDIPQAWKVNLQPMLRTLSKKFNEDYAKEDVETF